MHVSDQVRTEGMKSTRKPEKLSTKAGGDLRPEYRLHYTKAKSNRFAGTSRAGVVVVLDEDVAEVFRDTKSVNQVLRAIVSALPTRGKSGAKRG